MLTQRDSTISVQENERMETTCTSFEPSIIALPSSRSPAVDSVLLLNEYVLLQMQTTRDVAVLLHREGFLEIVQKGKPVDISKPMRGPIRLRLCKKSQKGPGIDQTHCRQD